MNPKPISYLKGTYSLEYGNNSLTQPYKYFLINTAATAKRKKFCTWELSTERLTPWLLQNQGGGIAPAEQTQRMNGYWTNSSSHKTAKIYKFI